LTTGAESAQLLYLLSMAAARSSIRLSMAYFVPERQRRSQPERLQRRVRRRPGAAVRGRPEALRRTSLEEWRGRPGGDKLLNAFAGVFSSQL
jgi:hypothetical protein